MVTRKEVLWFLTDHGPFRTCISRDQEVKCRFCGLFVETGQHLAFNCAAFDRRFLMDNFSIDVFEKLIVKITIELYKFSF